MDAQVAQHPTDQTLSSYGLGKLDDGLAESVNEHLESCPACRRRVAELTSDSFVGRLRNAWGRPDSPAAIVSSTAGLSMLAAEPGSPAPAPPPPSTLPAGLADHRDYEIMRELGRGGMGIVYLAENKLMGRQEVLKVVSSQLINRRNVLDRFLAEIRNAARLHHPNVVTAYSAIRIGESVVLAMEYVEGLDLAKMVEVRGPLPVANACNYVHQAALGLQHAHKHGMVHRDIKPSNLMLARQGDRALIKVLDFGLAKVQSEGVVDGGLTRDGQMLGTPDYIAPEQISDARRADIRADIYSLGCTLYYLLTGGPPFQGTSLYDVLQAHHSTDAKPLNLVRPEVPVELAALVAKMMAKEPERRFQQPKEVAQALAPFFKKGNVAPTGSKPEVSRAPQPQPNPATDGAGSLPTRPATESAPAPEPPVSTPAQRPRTEPTWESLVDLKETEPVKRAATDVASNRRRPWLWTALAAAVLVLGFVAVLGTGVLKIKTSEGFIVLKKLPDQAMVLIDGKKATVHWPDSGGPAEITAPPGEHVVQVKKDGFTMKGQRVTVETGGKTTLIAELEPLGTALPKKGDDVPARSAVAKPPAPPAKMDEKKQATTRLVPAFTSEKGKKSQDVVKVPDGPVATDKVVPPAVIISGSWRVDGQELVQSDIESEARNLLLLGDKDWSSYDMKLSAKIVAGWEGFFIYFHHTSDKDRGEVYVGDNGRTSNYIRFLSRGRDVGEDKGNNFRTALEHWYDVRMQVRGRKVEFDVDGERWFQCDAGPLARGQIVLGTWKSAVRFKDISVSTPEGKTLWEGIPELPPAVVVSGTWRVEGQEFVQQEGAGTILLGDKELSSYDMKFQGQIVTGNEGFVALFHYTDASNHRFFHVGELDGKRADLGLLDKGQESSIPHPTSIEKGRWYKVWVKVRDAECWCYLDGQMLLHDVNKRFTKGRIGLATWAAKARYRDIVIATPEGTILWSGLPQLAGN